MLVLDTDFLIKISNDPLPKFDLRKLASEYPLATIQPVISELEGLSRHKLPKTARRARNALAVLKENGSGVGKITVLEEPRTMKGKEADEKLLDLARSSEVVIATLDHSLLSRLDIEGLSYLTLRNDRPLLKEQRI